MQTSRKRWIARQAWTAVIKALQMSRAKELQLKPTRKAAYLQQYAILSKSLTSVRAKGNVKSTAALGISAMPPQYQWSASSSSSHAPS